MALWLTLFPQTHPWETLRTALFDAYQKTMPRSAQSQPVIIVDIDEASLKDVGHWPWPRNQLATLIERIGTLGALAIGTDIFFPEPDGTSPQALAANLPPTAAALAMQLRKLPSHDATLAQTLARFPTVLSVVGMSAPTSSAVSGFVHVPLHAGSGSIADVVSSIQNYPYALASLPQLQRAARGQALVNVDLEEGIVRRIPLIAAIHGVPAAALSMEMLRVATDSSAVEIESDPSSGITAVQVADLRVPTESDGRIWLHFAHPDASRYVSATDVLQGRITPERLANKLVLIGVSGVGLTDMRTTPLGDLLPGVDIQAQMIESFFDQRFLRRPHLAAELEVLALLCGGGLLVFLTPVYPLRRTIPIYLGLSISTLALGWIAFGVFGWLIDVANLVWGWTIVYAILLAAVYQETVKQRRLAEAALQRERLEAARTSGELNAARRIQLGALPTTDAFAQERRFRIAASLEPARLVGGDLYDFFMLDAHRLFFVIGDVAGKGVPASLFVAVVKALTKSAALRQPLGQDDNGVFLRTVVQAAHLEINRENPEMLFVTLIAGILDADEGQVDLLNAGHDAPWRLVSGQEPVQAMLDGGPPLCVVDDFDYPTDRLSMLPGECLCFVTDGVTEAANAEGHFYGASRLQAVLRCLLEKRTSEENVDQSIPDAVVRAIRTDVGRFAGEADASDDLTILVIGWRPEY